MACDLKTILEASLSHDANQRVPAEEKLSSMLQQDPTYTLGELLTNVVSNQQRQDIQQSAAVYIRRTLKQNTALFRNLNPEFQQNFKSGLLNAIASDGLNLRMKRAMSDIVEILAIQLFPHNQWSDLLSVIEKFLNQEKIEICISGLYILGLVVNGIPKCLDANSLNNILQLLIVRLQHQNEDIRVETMKAISRVLFVMEDASCCEPVVPAMFQLLQSNDEQKIQTVLECLTELCKDHSEIFLPSVSSIQAMFTQIATQSSLENETKVLALEFLITLAENEPHKIRRNAEFISSAIDMALYLMISLEHDHQSWNSNAIDTDDQDFDIASHSLTRLSEAVGAPKFSGPCMQRIDNMLTQEGWNYKHAGLVALCQVMESLKKKKVQTKKILNRITKFVQDPHPRVRYATISAFAIMCTDFGGKFVNRNCETILNSFYEYMKDNQNPKLQAHATKCIVNFCEKASKKLFMKNLKNIVQALFELTQSTQVPFVQENICSAMAEVANVAGIKFREFYPTFAPYLLTLMSNEGNGDEIRLESFRCLTYIGRAVGMEMYLNDAVRGMQLSQNLVKFDADILELIDCWGRVAQVLADDFKPFISAVTEEAAKFAMQECEMRNYDSDHDDGGAKLVEYNEKLVALDANKLEEKEAGLLLLGKLAEHCPNCFAPVLQESIGIVMPLIAYPLHRSIRAAALESIDGFSHCAIATFSLNENTQQFFLNTLQTLCQRLSEEEEMSVLSLVAHTIKNILSKNNEFTQQILGENEVGFVVRSLIKCVRQMNERINEREMHMAAPDLDDEDKEDFQNENKDEADVSRDITDAIDALFRIYKATLLPLITDIMDDFSWMISDDAHPIQRTTVLRIFCYIFENCDSNSTEQLMTQTLPRFLECTIEAHCDVRQAAVYALGLIAEQLSTEKINSFLPTILSQSFQLFDQNMLLDESHYDYVLDNAASTIGKILKSHPTIIPNISEVYKMWLQKCFPMREDYQEGEWCYQRFCELLNQQDAQFLGQNMENLPLIVDSMADAYGSSLMTDESELFFKNLLGNLKNQNGAMLTQIIMNLNSDNQAKVMQIVSMSGET